MNDQVEHVARALYAVEQTGTWEEEAEAVRDEYRQLASEAITMLKDHSDEIRSIVASAGTLRTRPEAN